MDIKDISDSVIDRIWKREEVTDDELWDAFWSLTEAEAREYSQQRWFSDRHVTQNHITRKVKRFWPVIDGAVTRVKRQLESDPTHPKVWRAHNYDYEAGGTLGHVMAGTRDEAVRLFQLFMPTSEAEVGHTRFVEVAFVAPAEDARIYCSMQNAVTVGGMVEKIRDQGQIKESAIKKFDAKVAKLQSRQDSFMILMASVGGGMPDAEASEPEADSSDSDTVAEEVDF